MERQVPEHGIGIMTVTAADIDLAQAIHDEIYRVRRSNSRMNEVNDVVKAALSLSTMCMAPAMAEIALDVFQSPDQTKMIGDWEIQSSLNHKGNVIDMLLRRPGQQGAWHLSVEFKRAFSDIGLIRDAELQKEMSDRCKNMSKKDVLDTIISALSDEKGQENAFESDPENYRDVVRGDEVSTIRGTALLASLGAPERIESSDACRMDSFWPRTGKGDLDIWWPGIALAIRPQNIAATEQDFHLEVGRTDGFLGPELLSVVSSLIEMSGYGDMVRQASRQIASASFWNPDVGNSVNLAEIGIAAVLADEGFYGATTMGSVAAFSAGIAQADFQCIRDEVYTLIKELDRNGFSSKEKEYDCNDLSDSAYLTQEDLGPRIHVGTQNGKFQLDLDEATGTFTAYRKSGSDKFLGEFKAGDSRTGARQAPYCSRNVRDLNNLLSVLPSLSACIEQDYQGDDALEP